MEPRFENTEGNILIVGNAHVAKSFAHIANDFTEVLRLNKFRTVGFEHLVRSKTTMIALNAMITWDAVEPGD